MGKCGPHSLAGLSEGRSKLDGSSSEKIQWEVWVSCQKGSYRMHKEMAELGKVMINGGGRVSSKKARLYR